MTKQCSPGAAAAPKVPYPIFALPPLSAAAYPPGMTLRSAFPFASIYCAAALLSGCTSVKVNRLTQEKFPKVVPKEVSQANPTEAAQRPHVKVATIDMKTKSPFAANLNALAHERTGKLGGNAYVITGGTATSSITGSLVGLVADKTEASMNIDVLRWNPMAPPKTLAAAGPNASLTAATGATSAEAAEPVKKKKRWYWPFG